MKIPTIVSLLALSLVFSGCSKAEDDNDPKGHHEKGDNDKDHKKGDNDEKPTSKPKTGMLRKIDGKDFQMFGGGVEGTPMSVSDAVAKAAELEGKEVVLTGKVSSYCEAAGCWFSIKEGDHKVLVQLGHDDATMKAIEAHLQKIAVAKGTLTKKADRFVLSASGFGIANN